MITTAPKRLCSSTAPEWLAMRMQGISASDAPAACGVSEWSTPLELYFRKRGELPPIEDNRAMRLGRLLEPIVADEFEIETGLHIDERQPGLFADAEHSHILATPDAVIDGDTLLEIKTIGNHRAGELGEDGTDEIPWEWNIQAQQQLRVMGAKLCWFAVLVGGQDLRIYQVERHEVAIGRIVSKVSDLWERIQTGNPPEMSEGHRSNLDLARQLYGKVKEGEIIDLPESVIELWQHYEACAKESKRQENLAKSAKAEVLLHFQNAEAGQLPDGRWLRRKKIERAGYMVAPCEYIDLRAVSAKTY